MEYQIDGWNRVFPLGDFPTEGECIMTNGTIRPVQIKKNPYGKAGCYDINYETIQVEFLPVPSPWPMGAGGKGRLYNSSKSPVTLKRIHRKME